MTILIENEVDAEFDFDYTKIANDVINTSMDLLQFPFEAEVSITITDNQGIQSINKEFRDIDSPTDVLSFPMIDYDTPGDFTGIEANDDLFNPETGEVILGDIVLCVDRIYSQAEEYGHSILREYAFLITHSMLHLFGFDHMTEAEANVMEEKQREILETLNISRDLAKEN
ncbi:MAG: rRNA maturation RNase YbeY [Pseudobutyrivibrio sp.]|nr:rRNA maturation RNase YbeY [Pseudobutyrivibrio sp.]